ncbi:helix-turn-helix domain-containing protein [Massilia sp. W12]|uniref:GlxA family transcriptional regulator n=1 Tax=Massilia sp. W12 TaxID=3126507 RepID=UPI0030D278DC
MSFPLAHLAVAPLALHVMECGQEAGAGFGAQMLASLLQQGQRLLGPGRLQVRLAHADDAAVEYAPATRLLILCADAEAAPAAGFAAQLQQARQTAPWGVCGGAIAWAAHAGALEHCRVALPLALHADWEGEDGLLSANLFEYEHGVLSCCGGVAMLDFGLCLLESIYGPALALRLREQLCIEHVRAAHTPQVQIQGSRQLPPKLVEVLELMQANIEEPLSSDDLAQLVDISRRQLERLFKQYLSNLPSRYYLEMRLARARTLLLESHHSIVQVGLMCGFSSGSHFSTAFSALYGLTPREERQRKLRQSA